MRGTHFAQPRDKKSHTQQRAPSRYIPSSGVALTALTAAGVAATGLYGLYQRRQASYETQPQGSGQNGQSDLDERLAAYRAIVPSTDPKQPSTYVALTDAQKRFLRYLLENPGLLAQATEENTIRRPNEQKDDLFI